MHNNKSTKTNRVQAGKPEICFVPLNKNFCNWPPDFTSMEYRLALHLLAEAMLAFDEWKHGYALQEGKAAIKSRKAEVSLYKGDNIINFSYALSVKQDKDGIVQSVVSKPYSSTARRAYRQSRFKDDSLPVPDILNVEIPSTSELLRRLGYQNETRTRKRLLNALDTLKTLELHFPDWHSDRYGRQDRWLGPLIKGFAFRSGNRMTVAVSGEWLDTCLTYFVKVPLPLPDENSKNAERATVTKLLLWLLAWDRSPSKSHYYHLKTICKWVDIETDQKRWLMIRALKRALAELNRYLKRLDRVALAYEKTPIPRRYRLDIHKAKGLRFVAVPEDRVRLNKNDLAYLKKLYPEAV